VKFSPANIQALKAADPRIKRLPHAALIACLAAIEREADHIACSCGNAAECASYDLETHTVTRHGQTVLKAVWFPEREAGQPTGPLKIEKVTHA
jgi:hypothetical protein